MPAPQKAPILQQLMDWIAAGIIAAIGVALAAHRSSYLVDYAVIVFVFNRGLRRMLDYYAGTFNPLSPISLTPLLVTALMMLPFLASYNRLTRPLKVIFGCLFVALISAFFVGFARIQFAAVYAAAEALAPIAMFGYIVTSSPTPGDKRPLATHVGMVRNCGLCLWLVPICDRSAVGFVLGEGSRNGGVPRNYGAI